MNVLDAPMDLFLHMVNVYLIAHLENMALKRMVLKYAMIALQIVLFAGNTVIASNAKSIISQIKVLA